VIISLVSPFRKSERRRLITWVIFSAQRLCFLGNIQRVPTHRKATLNIERNSFLLCVLLDESLRATERAWLIPLRDVPHIAADREDKYVIRANKQVTTNDKFKKYQCVNMAVVAEKLIEHFENAT
jgi:hypothetical protein